MSLTGLVSTWEDEDGEDGASVCVLLSVAVNAVCTCSVFVTCYAKC